MTRFLENAILKACCQLKSHGMVVYNADDARLNRWIERHDLPALSYGIRAESSVFVASESIAMEKLSGWFRLVDP